MPVQWNGKQPHPGLGSVVGMFRQPSQRLLSARDYMHRHRGCCKTDWGLSRKQGERARAAATAAAFASLPGMRGCMAKMLLGGRCCDIVGRQQTLARLPRAVAFVEQTMAFVGLLEEWERSVCLWHAKFGGPLFAAELRGTEVVIAYLRICKVRGLLRYHRGHTCTIIIFPIP